MRVLHLLFVSAVFLPSLRAQTTVAAETPSPHAETAPSPAFDLRLGGFLLSGVSTNLQLGTDAGSIGSNVDFANVLGGESSLNVFRFDGTWNISGRHSLEASWYDIDLRGRRTLDRDITFGGEIYHVGATIDSRYRTDIYRIAYGYQFYHEGRHEITGLLGLHVITFETSLAATNLGAVKRFRATAPLPSLGFAWKTHWTDRLSTRVSFQYFGLSLDSGKYSGHFTDILAAAEYRVIRQGGIGVGYNRFDLKGKFRAGPLILAAKYGYNGLLTYVFVNF